jgi:hypothetical protein
MATFAKSLDRPLSAVLALGDNFYTKLTPDRFEKHFEQLYSPEALDCPFYACAGNHDYGTAKYEFQPGKLQMELDYAKEHPTSRWKFPSKWYTVELPNPEKPLVKMIVLDGNYWEGALTPQEKIAQRRFLETELQKKSDAPWLWLVMAIGAVILLAFPKLEHAVARAGGMPLIDLSLLADAAFLRGLGAAFFFFFANLSFYLVMTLFMQRGLKIPPLAAGMAFIPLALAFVVASRHSGARARHRGTRVLIEGCALQIAGLAALALVAFSVDAPSALLLALTMIVFGYGQGLVMAPLSGAVLSTVKPVAAGSASGIYGTTAQIGNAAGVAAIGAVFFALETVQSARAGFLVSLALFVTLIMICAAFLAWMRRASARS